MRKSSILLLSVLGALLISTVFCSNAIGPTDCCFKVYLRKIPKGRVKTYSVTDERCTKAGIIFVTQSNRSICVDPNALWVQNIMKSLDEKSI